MPTRRSFAAVRTPLAGRVAVASAMHGSVQSEEVHGEVDEFQLQLVLADLWARGGVSLDGGERLLLVAREVMVPTWEINDSHRRWNLPSIDFLALDASTRLVAIELKVRVSEPKHAWLALCQVTHRAVQLGRTYTSDRLSTAWRAGSLVQHKQIGNAAVSDIFEEHRVFFGLASPRARAATDVRRIIAATEFGGTFPSIVANFNARPLLRTLDDLDDRYQAARAPRSEFQRVRDVMPLQPTELSTGVEALLVPIPLTAGLNR